MKGIDKDTKLEEAIRYLSLKHRWAYSDDKESQAIITVIDALDDLMYKTKDIDPEIQDAMNKFKPTKTQDNA